MINPVFANKYDEKSFVEFIQNIIPNLLIDKKRSEIRTGFKSIQQIAEVSENKLDLVVFVVKLDSSLHARVGITKNTYAVLKNHARSNALVAYISDDSSEWRLSLITTRVTRTKDGVKESISNPRRFSYVLGPNAKVATPSKMLQGVTTSINDLGNKFSLAVVSKEFFTQIATQYSKLVGGTRGEGRNAVVFERTLKLGNTDDAVNANFAIRLIGRLVFCWFLKQKKGHLNNPLIPSEILSVSAVKTIGDYYHSVCVPLFFEVLNKPQSSRPTFFSYSDVFDKVPFLNGGLFQDHAEDNHKFNRTTGMSERRGVVNVPDVWFSELFQIFEEYNFTIDENTSIDTELSIDPEMLGRIFENLLAEVNPETGASARKSTGSFYTPREIVDFMVEESLIAHFKTKTNISEEKLRALSSYDLDDDASYPIDPQEQKILVETIHNTTILDPACGSGAFPIGVLQRLVHMLEVLDPECSIYLNKIPPEMRRQLQKYSLTYVRKLGIIRKCIHGVDIQPIAIDISRLRCFLTLIVDQQVDDNAPNRGIEPLPNLDFKFVCANTLIRPPVHEGPLFGDEFADALGELINEYFAPVDQLHKLETARKLQQLISDKTNKELENIIKSYSHLKDEKHKQELAQKNEKLDAERMRINNLWKSYENIFQNKPVGFFDTRYFFPIVFRKGGFDIVIANPPYVDSETMTKSNVDIRNIYKSFYSTAKGNWDLFVIFIEKGFQLLKNDGIISYIVPNKLIGASYTKELRKFLLSKKILELRDYSRVDVFKEVNVYPIVFVAVNNNSRENVLLTSMESGIEIKHKMAIKPELFYKDTYWDKYFLPQNQLEIILKLGLIENLSTVVKNINEASTVSEAYKIKEYLQESSSENALGFKKFINTGTIDPYVSLWGNKKTQYIKHAYINPVILDSDLKRLSENRYKQACANKIIISGMSKRLECFYDEGQYLAGKSTTIILEDEKNKVSLKYLLALMNSQLLSFWYINYFNSLKMAGGFINVSSNEIELLPLLKVQTEQEKPFIEIVDKILAITKSVDYLENPAKKVKVNEYERQIDKMVYKLYDLTDEEIKIINDSIKN